MTDLKCSMGCPYLDNMMGGGISCGMITELVGMTTYDPSLETRYGLYT